MNDTRPAPYNADTADNAGNADSRPASAMHKEPEKTPVPATDCDADAANARPISRSDLYALAQDGSLSAPALEGALRLLGVRPGIQDWARYWFHLFSACGALFLASGVICFIAWNWHGLSHFAKFGILEGLVTCCALVALWRGPFSAAGAASLMAAGLCLGPLLAVFGQTYMSGAHMWELYRAWTCMLLPLALLGGQSGLWLLTWLTASIWGLGYMANMSSGVFFFCGFPEFMLAQFFALGVLELCIYRANGHKGRAPASPHTAWLRGTWLPRLMLFTLTALTTVVLSAVLLDTYYFGSEATCPLFLPFMPSTAILYGLGLFGLYFWYRYKRPDLFMLGCGLFSLCTLPVVALLGNWRLDLYGLFFLGLFVVMLTAACGKLLLHWQRRLEEKKDASPDKGKLPDETQAGAQAGAQTGAQAGTQTGAQAGTQARTQAGATASQKSAAGEATPMRPFSFERPAPSREAFQNALKAKGLLAADRSFPQPQPPGAPWYINTMLGFGGWLSALLFVGFIGILLYEKLRYIQASYDELFLILGILLLIGGAGCSRLPGMFARQFGLASAIAGSVLAVSSLIFTGDKRFWPAPCLLICVMGFVGVNNATFRFIAAVSFVFLSYYLMDILVWNTPDYSIFHYRYHDDAESIVAALSRSPLMAFFWLALFALLAICWRKQSQWLARKGCARILDPLLYGVYAGLLLLPALASGLPALSGNLPAMFGPAPFLLYPRAGLGLSAAAGCLFFIYLLGSRSLPGQVPGQAPDQTRGHSLYPVCILASLFVFPLGWYLPGAAIALFGFLVSRYIGNTVLFGATALFLTADIIHYYYSLNDTLLQKSCSLAICGATLLCLGVAVRFFFNRNKAAEAPAGFIVQTRRRGLALLAALAVIFGVFQWTAMQKEPLLTQGTTMYLRLAPVDPRAFLLGDYMALRYSLENDVSRALKDRPAERDRTADGQIVVRLSDQNVASFARFADTTPPGPGEHLLFYRMKSGRPEVAAHSFFFQEGHAADYENAAYGEIHVDESGKCLLTHLLDGSLQRIAPEKD